VSEEKFQTPNAKPPRAKASNSNPQASGNDQASNFNFGAWSFPVAWSLVLGVFLMEADGLAAGVSEEKPQTPIPKLQGMIEPQTSTLVLGVSLWLGIWSLEFSSRSFPGAWVLELALPSL